MNHIIQQYLDGLESGNPEKILQLFSDDAIIHSPLYGDSLAKAFFKRLFSDTYQSEITLLNIFNSLDKPDLYAAHFRYQWILKSGAITLFECIDVFQFNEQGKIKEMTIIYDTHNSRTMFESLS
ncbi:MAG: nuclear transport factor 2 family protein [Ferruginibacter sp.]